ncbi:MAG: heme-binding protein [Hyphomicrobiales bacterium]|nr:heme-binding protein [Hyphomicrobiales bacterium]
MPAVSLKQANAIISAALAEGRKRGLKPLTVAVLDPGGHLVALQREDGSGILRVEIASGKAYGALGMGFGSRELAERARTSAPFIAAVAAASGGRMVPAAGGVLILDRPGGDVQGAVGISGDISDEDEACALAGIAAAGLIGVTGLRD